MKNRFTDYEIREMWKAWGGNFHGPHVETATMPEANFLKMMRAIQPGRHPRDNKTGTADSFEQASDAWKRAWAEYLPE